MTDLYRHFDVYGKLLYVGISLSAYERHRAHRRTSDWAHDSVKMTIERFASRTAAERAEREAIARERPLWNIVGADAPHPDFIVFNDRKMTIEQAARVVVAFPFEDYSRTPIVRGPVINFDISPERHRCGFRPPKGSVAFWFDDRSPLVSIVRPNWDESFATVTTDDKVRVVRKGAGIWHRHNLSVDHARQIAREISRLEQPDLFRRSVA